MSYGHKDRSLPEYLRVIEQRIKERAKAYGLDFWEIVFELVDSGELNEVAAFGGFPTRYPHWKFGMAYDELSKGYCYGLSKIYELVINNDPCYAYLMKQNATVDQKLVMAHVCGHADFFKNNMWFAHTNRKMVDKMANNAVKIRKLADKYGFDKIEGFINTCLTVENLIDIYSPYVQRKSREEEIDETRVGEEVSSRKLKSNREYMDRYINPPEFLKEQEKLVEETIQKQVRNPLEPQRDVLLFLLEHAPLKPWQITILEIIREEAYYFAPQGLTKHMNEGWACLTGETRVFTKDGLVRMKDVVESKTGTVHDGESAQKTYDYRVFENRDIVKIETSNGFILRGSNNHRIMLANGEWCRLDELKQDDIVSIPRGMQLWPDNYVPIRKEVGQNHDITPERLAEIKARREKATTDQWVFNNYHGVGEVTNLSPEDETFLAHVGKDISDLVALVEARAEPELPGTVTEELASLLGYLVGDGSVIRKGRTICLTSGDYEIITRFSQLSNRLFGKSCSVKKCENRWCAIIYSVNAIDFLENVADIKIGRVANIKTIPEIILRSPKSVVTAFLRSYYDLDGYVSEFFGIILSTSSREIAETLQVLLLNYGIIAKRTLVQGGCYEIRTSSGYYCKIFAEEIGFNLERKTEALSEFISGKRWFKNQLPSDKVVSIETGVKEDVYDISVENTHRYSASGFINHNSTAHTKLMPEIVEDAEVVDYIDIHSGTMGSNGGMNPYKIGLELYRDIEDRWNRGRFGKDYDECQDLERKRDWDLKLGLGKEKMFQVRRIYNDVTFIEEFLTEDFCKERKLFVYDYDKTTGQYIISSRNFRDVKERYLRMLTNFGHPVIYVDDANYKNRGELYLRHKHEGVDLEVKFALATLSNLYKIWSRPVHIETIADGQRTVIFYDGEKHGQRNLDGDD